MLMRVAVGTLAALFTSRRSSNLVIGLATLQV